MSFDVIRDLTCGDFLKLLGMLFCYVGVRNVLYHGTETATQCNGSSYIPVCFQAET